MSEPLQKRQKTISTQQPTQYMFNIGYLYLSTYGKIVKVEDPITTQIQTQTQIRNIPLPIMHIQRVDHADIYIIGNLDCIKLIDVYKSYTLSEIFTKFKNGYFSIGVIRDFYNHSDSDNDTKNIITDISDYYDDNNSEIRLHYTTSRDYPGNVAWNTITWDLFEEYVSK